MNRKQLDAILDAVRAWPPEDQEQLVEAAREIEARRAGVYVMTDDERHAIAKARQSPLASDDEVAAFWKRTASDENSLPRTLIPHSAPFHAGYNAA